MRRQRQPVAGQSRNNAGTNKSRECDHGGLLNVLHSTGEQALRSCPPHAPGCIQTQSRARHATNCGDSALRSIGGLRSRSLRHGQDQSLRFGDQGAPRAAVAAAAAGEAGNWEAELGSGGGVGGRPGGLLAVRAVRHGPPEDTLVLLGCLVPAAVALHAAGLQRLERLGVLPAGTPRPSHACESYNNETSDGFTRCYCRSTCEFSICEHNVGEKG